MTASGAQILRSPVVHTAADVVAVVLRRHDREDRRGCADGRNDPPTQRRYLVRQASVATLAKDRYPLPAERTIAGRLRRGWHLRAARRRRLADGERPRMRDMLLTPANVARVADQLSHLRGAAMKLGQMISMDAGDFLPAELTQILARLRERAHHMPPAQLQQVLTREWGANWRRRFAQFEAQPMAAASIGQVHRGRLPEGPLLAIKVQYPGVRESMRSLIALVLREMFEFGLMQTDPNFANYRYQPAEARLVLPDFGATRAVAAATVGGYRRLLEAGLAGDRDAVREAAIAAGFLGEAAAARHRALIDRMIDVIIGELQRDGPFDFGDRGFVGVLREQGMAMAADRETWHVPPADTLFVQRKISGTALLAARLHPRSADGGEGGGPQ